MNNLCDLHLFVGKEVKSTNIIKVKNPKGEDLYIDSCEECKAASELTLKLILADEMMGGEDA